MLIRQVNIVGTPGLSDIHIRNEKIQEIYSTGEDEDRMDPLSFLFRNAIAFPGLINSHDHLDFNLFPQLGNRIYRNYTEWGRDIHAVNKEAIKLVLQIPRPLRSQWGIYKNLLNGVTTVVNHGKYLPVKNDLITVFQDSRSLHSPAFEKHWKWKLNAPFARKRVFVIHLGEGTDAQSGREIDSLIKWNMFKRKIIAIHGVAMTARQATAFGALIWCPASNYFLLNKTAAVNSLSNQLPVMLGADSTLTASWNFWQHLRLARKEGVVSDELLMNMFGSIPAKIWGLGHSGKLAAGEQADLVVASGKKEMTAFDRFYALNPEDLLLVLHKGRVRLFDAGLLQQVVKMNLSLHRFSKMEVNGKIKFVEGDLPGLMLKIRNYYPGAQFPVSAC